MVIRREESAVLSAFRYSELIRFGLVSNIFGKFVASKLVACLAVSTQVSRPSGVGSADPKMLHFYD